MFCVLIYMCAQCLDKMSIFPFTCISTWASLLCFPVFVSFNQGGQTVIFHFSHSPIRLISFFYKSLFKSFTIIASSSNMEREDWLSLSYSWQPKNMYFVWCHQNKLITASTFHKHTDWHQIHISKAYLIAPHLLAREMCASFHQIFKHIHTQDVQANHSIVNRLIWGFQFNLESLIIRF